MKLTLLLIFYNHYYYTLLLIILLDTKRISDNSKFLYSKLIYKIYCKFFENTIIYRAYLYIFIKKFYKKHKI